MAVVLLRVDERLVHGQVVIGWGHELRPDRYIVVDDDLAESEWEQELYALGAPEADTLFVSVEEARRDLDGWRDDPLKSVVLTRDISTMGRILEGASGHLRVNLGGLHPGADRVRVLDYLHLTATDREVLRTMGAAGVDVAARNLPDAQPVPLATLLDS